MDCREFRNKHVTFVDDLLPAVEMDAMRRHLVRCSGCSRQDVRVRRGLMLVRNLPPIEASPDFMARLNERIAEMGPVSRTDMVRAARPSYSAMIAAAALAAGMVAVAYMTIETNEYFAPTDSVRVVPTLAAIQDDPVPGTASMANAAMAAVPTGIPVWPAVLMAGQSPLHFANMEAPDVNVGR
ncbi:MAG TPA: zf-HC2 domain-containing protein [Gemmatimonadaceae bacterium]|jgi:hypothetical protein|nr:zf-HC2 domain-containing protein [Gemmatimonadaceae bacterium]